MSVDRYALAFPPFDVESESVSSSQMIEPFGELPPLPLRSITREQYEQCQAELAASNEIDSAIIVPPVPPRGSVAPAAASAETAIVEDLGEFPYAIVGKLRLGFPRGSFAGSGWVIGRRCIITAGHCVFDRRAGGWANRIQFLPQYRSGQSLGTWTVVKQTALREFVESDDLRFDLAACILDRDIAPLTGMAGYALNRPIPDGKLLALGYPAEASRDFPFDGERHWRSFGDYVRRGDAGAGGTLDRNYPMLNDLTGGCSGGPIFDGSMPPLAVGLNSHVVLVSPNGPREVPHRMYSPFLGKAFERLLDWLTENGAGPNRPGLADDRPPAEDAVVQIKDGLGNVVRQLNELIAKLD